MPHREFFDAVPPLRMRDPLAQFLGATDDGVIEYGYVDAIKLAGHSSCPTVAGILTRQVLRGVYGADLPQRGAIRAEFHDDRTTSVIANVVSLLAGATGDTGCKGLGGRLHRHRLLVFNADVSLEIRFMRMDTVARFDAAAHVRQVPGDPEMPALLQPCMRGQAGPERGTALRRDVAGAGAPRVDRTRRRSRRVRGARRSVTGARSRGAGLR